MEKRQAVLSAGDTHGNPVPVLDHLIFVHSLSGQIQKTLSFHDELLSKHTPHYWAKSGKSQLLFRQVLLYTKKDGLRYLKQKTLWTFAAATGYSQSMTARFTVRGIKT